MFEGLGRAGHVTPLTVRNHAMATYHIFTTEGGQRIAINPDSVSSIIEIERGRVAINLPDGGSATISMSLENVVARLTSGPESGPPSG
jgi:hypothetical protein